MADPTRTRGTSPWLPLRLLFAGAVISAAVVLSSCPEPGACSATTCTGCCNAEGTCVAGTEASQCGTGGAACADCGMRTCGAGGACAAGPTAGDACALPHEIVLISGVGTATGSTTGQRDDASGSCAASGAPDVVYRFTTSAAGTLNIDVRATSAGFKPALYVRSACDTAGAELAAACNSTLTAGGTSSLTLHNLAAGTYFLWVDGRDATSGSFTVNMTLGTGTGETCFSPLPLAFGGGEANVAGSTAGLTGDGSGACGGGAAPDAVYRFDVTSPSILEATLATTTVNARPVLYLRTSCSGGERGCSAAGAGEAAAILRSGTLPVGTYYLWVDAVSGPLDYTLHVLLRPPEAGEICTLARPLTFSNGAAGGTAMATGDTTPHFNDGASTIPTCSGTGPDVVYELTTNTPLTLRASVSTTSSTYQPTLYVRPTDCTAGIDQACGSATAPGGSAAVAVQRLPAGTHYLWVDGAAGTSGPFTLSATLDQPLPGEGCTNPKPLTFSNGQAGGTASDTGDTTLYFDDGSGFCGVGTGNDVVYSFTINTVLDFRATLSGLSAAYRPVLYLRNGTCTGTASACTIAAAAGADTTLSVGRLQAGTYFLWVDGASGSAGAYTLDATLNPPQPGDSCANPKPLTFSNGAAGGTATDTGDTSTHYDDPPAGTCISGTSPDVVYTFTTNTALNFSATVTTTTSGHQPALYLRAGCNVSQLGCAAAPAGSGTASLSVGSLAAGTYYLWIDGAAGSAGQYSLTANLTPPPPGESCSNPKPLTFSSGAAGGTATDTGDTTGFVDNPPTGTCIAGASPDLVYTFTTNTVLNFNATVTTTTGTYRPALYLRTACGTAQLGCNAATLGGGTASLSIGSLAAGTYYLWIDGAAGTAGQYSLSASLTPPPPGETCANALPLTFSGGTTGGTASASGDTSTFGNDTTGTCGGSGPDVVYTFTTTVALDLAVTASTTSGTYQPALYLRSGTCTATERGCALAPAAGGTASLSVLSLAPGTHYLHVDGNGTAGPYALTASLLAPPPEAVRPAAIASVQVPGPMVVTYEVVDRNNTVVTADSATRFTVSVTGSATFTSATQGTIVSGAGTNSVLVNVANGVITLNVSDAVAETVTFTATDSQGNGLRYPAATYSQTSMVQSAPCDLSNVRTFTFPVGGSTPTGNGTVTVFARADLNASTEYFDVFLESTTGTLHGQVFATTVQCSPTYLSQSVTIPLASLQGYVADGQVGVAIRSSTGVNCICSPQDVYLVLSFPQSVQGTFLP